MRFRAAKSGSQRAGSGFSGMKTCFHAGRYDPDRLFKSGFLEYVFCVDQEIWALCGVEEKWLKDDSHGIWTSTTALPVDNECQEALHYIEMYGVQEAKSLCSHHMKIRQIFTLDERKAREILDELMKEFMKLLEIKHII